MDAEINALICICACQQIVMNSRCLTNAIRSVSNIFRKTDKHTLEWLIRNRPDIKMGLKLIEEGVDSSEKSLSSALYSAVASGRIDWVCMLLYYGADPNTPSDIGGLPITMAKHSGLSRENVKFLCDVLSPYTVDSRSLPLQTLVAAMQDETSWFCKVLGNVNEIVFGKGDVEFFQNNIVYILPRNLEVFVEKFPNEFRNMSEELVARGVLCTLIRTLSDWSDPKSYKVMLDIFLYKGCLTKLFISKRQQCCLFKKKGCFCTFAAKTVSMIAIYVETLGAERYITEEEVTERVLLMVTYGLEVTLFDLEVVYRCYGYCDLFEMLLHMDVEDVSRDQISSLVQLYYDPRMTIEDCFGDRISVLFLVDLYNDDKLKELCLVRIEEHNEPNFGSWYTWKSPVRKKITSEEKCPKWNLLDLLSKEGMLSKVRNMPQVSSLVELSRNVARKHIVETFQIRTSKELYSVLNGLPIDKLTKDTIKLRRKLY